MFIIDQIKEAHSRVRSGADFPAYIQELKALGVKAYETFVTDGHTVFRNSDGTTAQWDAKYAPLTIEAKGDKEQFAQDLLDHQQGKTDYPTFCKAAADLGIEKWQVDLEKMTCTYYNIEGAAILEEKIPS
jgi:uncharacterized protein YbcV (DUF1398 family)